MRRCSNPVVLKLGSAKQFSGTMNFKKIKTMLLKKKFCTKENFQATYLSKPNLTNTIYNLTGNIQYTSMITQ